MYYRFIFIQYLEPVFRVTAKVDLTLPTLENLKSLFESQNTTSPIRLSNLFENKSPILVQEKNYLWNLAKFSYSILTVSVPWFVLWLIVSFSFFHCYLNILAEITMFGDKLFFLDWWNTDNFQAL